MVNNNLRYIKWQEGSNSPEVLTMNDYKSLRNANDLIARKFDSNIDSNIIKKLVEMGEK